MKKLICVILFLSLPYCQPFEDEEDDSLKEDSIVTVIQPKAIFISGKKRIDLLSPRPSESKAGDFTFAFDTSEVSHASLLIFNSEVSINDIINGLGSSCVGGASSLAGHTWNNRTVEFNSGATNNIYACVQSNPNNFLSQSSKVNRSDLNTGTDYYWVVLGYNSAYVLTHVSSLNKFSTP